MDKLVTPEGFQPSISQFTKRVTSCEWAGPLNRGIHRFASLDAPNFFLRSKRNQVASDPLSFVHPLICEPVSARTARTDLDYQSLVRHFFKPPINPYYVQSRLPEAFCQFAPSHRVVSPERPLS